MSNPSNTPPPGNVISELVKIATDPIVGKYPTAVSVGATLGVVVAFLIDLFKVQLQNPYIDISLLTPYPLAAFFIFIGVVISAMRGPKLPPDVENAFRTIRMSKKEGKLTDAQAKALYVALCNRVIAEIDLKQEAKEAIEKQENK